MITVANDLERISRAFDMLLRVADSERVHLRRQQATGIDLSKTEVRSLRVVVERGAVTVTELGRLLHVSQPTASRTLSQLERHGLVGTASHVSDGRVTRYEPTDEGRFTWHRFHSNLIGELEAALASMPAGRRREFASLLESMVDGTYARRRDARGDAS